MPGFLYDRYQTCHYDPAVKAYYGCRQKITDVEQGSAGFRLVPDPITGGPTNLALLIDSLMKLCQQHWNSLDHASLAKYRSPESLKHRETTPSTEDQTAIDPTSLIRADLDLTPPYESSRSRARSSLVPPLGPAQSPFQDHREIIETFFDFLRRSGWSAKDKLKDDQCNLKTLVAELSSTSRNPKLTSSSVTTSLPPAGRSVGGRGGSSNQTGGSRSRRSAGNSNSRTAGSRFDNSTRREKSLRAGSKRKAVEAVAEVEVESDLEQQPEFVQGSSTGTIGARGGSKRTRID